MNASVAREGRLLPRSTSETNPFVSGNPSCVCVSPSSRRRARITAPNRRENSEFGPRAAVPCGGRSLVILDFGMPEPYHAPRDAETPKFGLEEHLAPMLAKEERT